MKTTEELRKVFSDIIAYQMDYVQLATTTEPYKLAEKGLKLLDKLDEPTKKDTLEYALTLINEAQLILQSIESGRILWKKEKEIKKL
jgi:hypothetical protein